MPNILLATLWLVPRLVAMPAELTRCEECGKDARTVSVICPDCRGVNGPSGLRALAGPRCGAVRA